MNRSELRPGAGTLADGTGTANQRLHYGCIMTGKAITAGQRFNRADLRIANGAKPRFCRTAGNGKPGKQCQQGQEKAGHRPAI